MSDYDNPYASPSPESVPPKLKTGLKFNLIRLLVIGGIIAVVIALMLPATRRASPAARRTQCKNNLKQIGLALYNYHDTYHAFPPAFTVDADGKPLHSWRTLLLPYLDQKPLYDKIDLAKAWDNPVNAEAFKTHFHVFHCPSTEGPMTHTTYMAVVGFRSCFQPAESRSLSEITDNHSETLMVIEVANDKAVHWMSPVDANEQFVLDFEPKSKLDHTGGTHALFVDGSVRFLSANLDPAVRRALISIDGNESWLSNVRSVKRWSLFACDAFEKGEAWANRVPVVSGDGRVIIRCLSAAPGVPAATESSPEG